MVDSQCLTVITFQEDTSNPNPLPPPLLRICMNLRSGPGRDWGARDPTPPPRGYATGAKRPSIEGETRVSREKPEIKRGRGLGKSEPLPINFWKFKYEIVQFGAIKIKI